MDFHSLAGRLAVAILALGILAGDARTQFGNPFPLNNGGEVNYIGVGAGGSQTAADGLSTFVAGEDLRGSVRTPLTDFGFRMKAWIEQVCLLKPAPNPAATAIRFPAIAFIELNGLNGHRPPVFTNPVCKQPSFPLGASGAVPYGLNPGSTASFVLAPLPTIGAIPYGTAAPAVLPNNGFSPAGPGTATLVGGTAANFPMASTGFCWALQFSFVASNGAKSLDDIDGWVHFAANSPDDNQYWLMSDDEQNLWQSQTVATDAGATALTAFPANVDYALVLESLDPVTVATLAPRAGSTFSAPWTTNVSNEYGSTVNPNGGFDVGRGSAALSFSGHAGVANPNTGLGNQDPSLGPGIVPTLGFATWDTFNGDYNGSVRLTWVSVDYLCLSGGNPATGADVLKKGGTVRVPVVAAGLLQPFTGLCFGLFGHVTRTGFFFPGPGTAPPWIVGGASNQLPVGATPPPCVGLALNLTYGTSGRKGNLGSPGALTFDQHIAATSGTRQLFLFE